MSLYSIFDADTFQNDQYRNSRAGARSTRTQIDHDVFEGLPVRHWRKAPVTVNVAPQKENSNITNMRNAGWPELPMPRDSHLLSPMSQALLRAARMGQVNKPTPPMEDEKDLGEEEDAEGEIDAGFVAKRWAVVPRHLEGAEPEYLAKRRKGLPSVYSGITGPLVGNSGQMRKTKVRKVDAEGNVYVWEVLVPEGQTVEGEIVEEETTLTEAPAPGTVVEGVGVANAEGVVIAGDQVQPTPPRRRPPPPKRKPKGPGRGRRKKVAFADGSQGAPKPNGVNGTSSGVATATKSDSLIKEENADNDTEMGDDSVLHEGDEGSEDDDDDAEDGDREEGELSPTPDAPGSLSRSPSKSLPQIVEPDPHAHPSVLINRDISSSPDLPLAAAQSFQPPPAILIDPAQDTPITFAPPLGALSPGDAISVEDAPEPKASSANAAIPAGHDLLDGLVEPEVSSEGVVRFEDGEEDLLGSLERSLDGRGK
ncbi:hypothetical protein MMC12_002782 [Toensbergia leucococca]|nr:hypothetical protein [Toensbergia leucococca]